MNEDALAPPMPDDLRETIEGAVANSPEVLKRKIKTYELALELLVIAGYVQREKIDQAIALAGEV